MYRYRYSYRSIRMLAMLAGPFLVYFGLAGYHENQKFKHESETALVQPNPTITSQVQHHPNHPEQDGTVYSATVTYVTQEGQTINVTKPISPLILQEMQSGQQLSVKYLMDSPQTFRWVQDYRENDAGSEFLFGLALCSLYFFKGKKKEAA